MRGTPGRCWNSTAQALRAGVPQLVMPYAFDQPDNASRVRRLGVGSSVNRQRYRATSAARQLEKVLNTRSYSERAAAVGIQVGGEDGVCVACDAVERAMGETTLRRK